MGKISTNVTGKVTDGDLRDVVQAWSAELRDLPRVRSRHRRRVVNRMVRAVVAEFVGIFVIIPNDDVIDAGKVVRDIGRIGDLLAAVYVERGWKVRLVRTGA